MAHQYQVYITMHMHRHGGAPALVIQPADEPQRNAEDFELHDPSLFELHREDEDLETFGDLETLNAVVNELAELNPESEKLKALLKQHAAPPTAEETFAQYRAHYGSREVVSGTMPREIDGAVDLAGAEIVDDGSHVRVRAEEEGFVTYLADSNRLIEDLEIADGWVVAPAASDNDPQPGPG